MFQLVRLCEHAVVAAAVCSLVRHWLKTKSSAARRAAAVLACKNAAETLKALGGHANVLSWKDVAAAPVPSMDVSSLQLGQVVAHQDNRGAIYRFKLGPDTLVNMYFTKAGYRRSGDLHDCTQYDVVLKGRTRLRLLDPVTGRETVEEYGPNDFIIIPPRTPHMFEFLEDNCLLEWWDDEFKAWYYRPYRSVIEAGVPVEEPLVTPLHTDVRLQCQP